MREQEWLSFAERHKEKLLDLVRNYHPSANAYGKQPGMKITTPKAEAAAETVRKLIQREERKDPVQALEQALKDRNIGKIASLLNSAWFGVPESTDAWRIGGFREAVELLEDPPEGDD